MLFGEREISVVERRASEHGVNVRRGRDAFDPAIDPHAKCRLQMRGQRTHRSGARKNCVGAELDERERGG